MKVTLCFTPAPQEYQSHTAFTLQSGQINIHLNQDKGYETRQIQVAARKIHGLNLKALELVGSEWTLERQWAFYSGISHPKGYPALQFEMNAQPITEQIKVAEWVKSLVNKGPHEIYPLSLAQAVETKLNEISAHVHSQIISGQSLKEQGFMGTYSVGKGSRHEPVIAIYDYNPSGNPDTPVDTCLVGKGITFDSGGYSLKPNAGMASMKSDMAGAASLAGALVLAIQQGLQKRIKLILCCAENMVSNNAYKLGDIIEYKNGETVEILNTDAEGRLVLADGLIIASRVKPKHIIDAATLTGAIIISLAHDYSGLFTMDDNLASKLIQSGLANDDPFWRMPLEAWHQDTLPSPYAKTANASTVKGGGAGGSSNAAGFLARFVDNPTSGWAHLDVAGTTFIDSGSGLYAPGATGRVFRPLADFLCNG